MRQHENGNFEGESLHRSSISGSTTSLESIFSSVSTHRPSKPVTINEEAVIKTLDMDAEDYEKKLQLGEIVYKHVKERGIPEESLSKEYKEAKDLYVKNKQNIDVENVILCPWQESLLTILNLVTEKLSGLLVVKETKEKHGFKSF